MKTLRNTPSLTRPRFRGSSRGPFWRSMAAGRSQNPKRSRASVWARSRVCGGHCSPTTDFPKARQNRPRRRAQPWTIFSIRWPARRSRRRILAGTRFLFRNPPLRDEFGFARWRSGREAIPLPRLRGREGLDAAFWLRLDQLTVDQALGDLNGVEGAHRLKETRHARPRRSRWAVYVCIYRRHSLRTSESLLPTQFIRVPGVT